MVNTFFSKPQDAKHHLNDIKHHTKTSCNNHLWLQQEGEKIKPSIGNMYQV